MTRGDTPLDWFVVTGTNGHRALARHIDYGPRAHGRLIDVNYTLAGRLGYTVTNGGCVLGYENGQVTATKIIADLHYPSCGWAGRQAVIQLRRRAGPLGAPGTCLTGRRAWKMRSFQFVIRHPRAARSGSVDLGTWRALYLAG